MVFRRGRDTVDFPKMALRLVFIKDNACQGRVSRIAEPLINAFKPTIRIIQYYSLYVCALVSCVHDI